MSQLTGNGTDDSWETRANIRSTQVDPRTGSASSTLLRHSCNDVKTRLTCEGTVQGEKTPAGALPVSRDHKYLQFLPESECMGVSILFTTITPHHSVTDNSVHSGSTVQGYSPTSEGDRLR